LMTTTADGSKNYSCLLGSADLQIADIYKINSLI